MPDTEILSPERVHRIVVRLAYEILERNRGADNLVVLGIVSKGEKIGRAIADEIARVEKSVPVHSLDVSAYRDDVSRDERGDADGMLDLTDRDVVLVDDVLFTGRTARAALDAIVAYGRPRSIQLVVLIDRGHREYPIHADYVGRAWPTKHRERIEVRSEPEMSVHLIE